MNPPGSNPGDNHLVIDSSPAVKEKLCSRLLIRSLMTRPIREVLSQGPSPVYPRDPIPCTTQAGAGLFNATDFIPLLTAEDAEKRRGKKEESRNGIHLHFSVFPPRPLRRVPFPHLDER